MVEYDTDSAVIDNGRFYAGIKISEKDTEQKNLISDINNVLGVTKNKTGCRDSCYEYQGINEIKVGNVVRINAGDCYNRTPYRISRKEKIAEYSRKVNYSIRAVPFDKRADSLELKYCVEITSKRIQRFTSCTIWRDKRDQPTKNSRWREMRSSSMTLNEVRVISDKVLAKVFDDVDNEAALISATI